MFKKIYNITLNMASKKNALYFLFAISFIESSFFPIPPDIMIIPMVLAIPSNAYRIALVATIASVLGGYFGYIIGWSFFDLVAKPVLDFYGYMKQFDSFKELYNNWGAWIVFGAGVTPFPYKVITIASGVVGLNIWVFGIASILSRGLRFFVVAWLLKKYGAPMKIFIEKNLNILAVLFFVLLIGSFALLKLL